MINLITCAMNLTNYWGMHYFGLGAALLIGVGLILLILLLVKQIKKTK